MRPDFRYLRWVILRRTPVFLTVFLLLGGGAVWLGSTLPQTYTATARLLIDPPEIPDDLAAPKVNTQKSEQLQIIKHRILTKDQLAAMASAHGVFSDSATPQEIIRKMQRATVFKTSSAKEKASVLSISFSAADPNIATRIANNFAALVLQEDARIRTERVEETLGFFSAEVAKQKGALDQAFAALSTFKRNHAGALPENYSYLSSRRLRLQDHLLTLEKQPFRRPVQMAKTREIARLETELKLARAQYPKTHPQVQNLLGQINLIQGQITRAAALSDTLNAQSDLRAELAQLSERINQIPVNAVLQDALERDYAVAQQRYKTATQQLTQAATGERIELLAKGEHLSLIEEAAMPNRPSKSLRKLAMLGGVALAFAMAAGLVIILERMDRVIRRPADLTKGLGLTPFALLPELTPPQTVSA